MPNSFPDYLFLLSFPTSQTHNKRFPTTFLISQMSDHAFHLIRPRSHKPDHFTQFLPARPLFPFPTCQIPIPNSQITLFISYQPDPFLYLLPARPSSFIPIPTCQFLLPIFHQPVSSSRLSPGRPRFPVYTSYFPPDSDPFSQFPISHLISRCQFPFPTYYPPCIWHTCPNSYSYCFSCINMSMFFVSYRVGVC